MRNRTQLSLLALVGLIGLLSLTPTVSASPQSDYVRANYTKYEYRIPMRDGKRLFTSVYIPNNGDGPWPMLLFRTPYSVRPYGADRYRESLGPTEAFAKEKFIFVYQDVRGRYMSEGDFVNMRPHIDIKRSKQDIDESTDTYDTIDWLLKHVPDHNGKLGQWGISYPGFYSSAGMIDSHPALKAVSPQAPIADWFWDDMHHHGAFILPLAFNFFSTFGKVRDGVTTESFERFDHESDDGYQFFLELGPLGNANQRYFKEEIPFWNELTRHPNYDEFWQSRNILPHLKNIKAAVMTVGGWYDTEDLYGPLKTYASIERQNPGIQNMLVMGPWSHGGWSRGDGETLGTENFGFKTAKYYQEHVVLPFFKHFLKEGQALDLPEALMFETGANRWREFDQWPPPAAQPRTLYFGDQGTLVESADAIPVGADEFPSDPRKPVPYTMEITTGWAKKYMTEDQRFAAWRPDVLVYQTEPLEEDLTLAGPINTTLWTSTTGTDADWIVKLIDVYPDEIPDGKEEEKGQGATQRLVRADAFRGRFRESYSEPIPYEPDTPAKVEFEVLDVLHTFKRGHRLMIQVQSTWFPFVDRNPQTYVPNIFEATEEDFVPATHRIHRGSPHQSSIEFKVLEPPQ
ncbi:MAG: CocE/NonD family hydrolase [Planctomycetota bacterium]